MQEQHIQRFELWAKKGNTPVTDKTFKADSSAVRRYGASIYVPNDIDLYHAIAERPLTEKVGKGANRLFRYLNTVLPKERRNLNGFDFPDFTSSFANAPLGESMDDAAFELSEDEMRRWVAYIPAVYQTFWQLLAYSGARIEQLHAFLSSVTPSQREELAIDILPDNDKILRPVFALNAENLSSGKKQVRRYYFPAEMKEVVLSYVPAFSIDTFKKAVTPVEWNEERAQVKVGGKPLGKILPKTLRKWLISVLLDNGVAPAVAGWIEGRVPDKENSEGAMVTLKRYAAMDTLAERAYSQVVDDIVKRLPLDAFDMWSAPVDAPTPLPKMTPAARDAEILRLYAEGKSMNEIVKSGLGAKATVQKVIKAAGESRANTTNAGGRSAKAKTEKRDTILRLAREGKTQREIAELTHTSRVTIRGILKGEGAS